MSWNIYFRLLRKKIRTENQQLFDGIIDVTSFDGVEGLDYSFTNFTSSYHLCRVVLSCYACLSQLTITTMEKQWKNG